MKNKKILITIGMVLILLGVNFISAEFWSCFNKGDIVYYCNHYKPDWTCDSNSGCEKCMSVYKAQENCYIHGVWPICMQIPQDCSGRGNGTIEPDTTPPNITLNSPSNGTTYNSRSILFSILLNELASISYTDLTDGDGRWTNICKGCNIYSNKRNFKEGANQIKIKAVDRVGNTAYKDVSFFVDSKKPQILKTEPKIGFADGNFEIQFKEENPSSLILHYGDKTKNINLINCGKEKSKTYCDNFIDLKEFDGEEINYWYILTDIAGSIAESKPIKIKIDTTAPIINNPSNFWLQNERYIYFNISVTENNFDKVSYSYTDSRGSLKEYKLCSTLKNGMCIVKKSFGRGHYDLTINILDKAGNSVGVPVSFDVN